MPGPATVKYDIQFSAKLKIIFVFCRTFNQYFHGSLFVTNSLKLYGNSIMIGSTSKAVK